MRQESNPDTRLLASVFDIYIYIYIYLRVGGMGWVGRNSFSAPMPNKEGAQIPLALRDALPKQRRPVLPWPLWRFR